MTDEITTTTTDDDADELTNKHLCQDLVSGFGYCMALQLLTIGLVTLLLLEPPVSWVSIAPVVFAFGAFLLPKAAGGSRLARRFFELGTGEQIDWNAYFPEGDA